MIDKKEAAIENQVATRDVKRLGIQLQWYVFALRRISEILKATEWSKPLDEELHKKLIVEISFELRKALISDITFLADEKGEFFFIDPPEKELKARRLPNTKQIRRLKEEGVPFVADNSYGHPRELKQLGLDSVLLVRLMTPLGYRYLGFANGHNDPPYLTLDRDFVNELLSIYSSKMKGEIEYAKTNYLDSLKGGNWEAIASSSKKYLEWLFQKSFTPPKRDANESNIPKHHK